MCLVLWGMEGGVRGVNGERNRMVGNYRGRCREGRRCVGGRRVERRRRRHTRLVSRLSEVI